MAPRRERHGTQVWLHERDAKLCVVRGAFAAHPQYGKALGPDVEARMHRAAHAALSLREALGDDEALTVDPVAKASRFSSFFSRGTRKV